MPDRAVLLGILYDSCLLFFFSSRRRHTRFDCDWSSDVCSSDLIQEFRAQIQARITDPSQLNAAKAEKDRMTRERLQRQGAQQQSQSQKQYKFQQAQKAWMAGAAVSPAVQDAAPTSPTTPSALDAASPASSPPVGASSPTASPAATLQTPSPTPE